MRLLRIIHFKLLGRAATWVRGLSTIYWEFPLLAMTSGKLQFNCGTLRKHFTKPLTQEATRPRTTVMFQIEKSILITNCVTLYPMPCHCIPHYLSHRQFLVYCLEVEPNGNRGNSLETSVPTQQIDHIIRRLRGFHSFLLLLSHFRPISFSPPSLISGPKTPEDTPIKVEKRRRTQDFVVTPSTVLLANRLRTDTCRNRVKSWFFLSAGASRYRWSMAHVWPLNLRNGEYI